MGRCLLGLALLASACSAKLADVPGGTADANTGIDSSTTLDDASSPDAYVLGIWGAATRVTGASSAAVAEDDPTLSANALEMVFAVQGANGKDLYHATRTSTTAAWSSPPVPLALNLTTGTEETPRFTADDLTLYFASDRVAGNGLDIYRITRPTIGGPWTAPALVTGPNSTGNEKWFAPCTGGRYLVIQGADIAEGTLGGGAPTVSAALSAPAANETGTFLTPDCLTTYFASTRSGPNRIYTSTRATVMDPWPTPTMVADFLALGGDQEDPWVSADQRIFLLASNVLGTKDVYISVR